MRVIKEETGSFLYKEKEYPVKIIYKTNKKNITYRFRDNSFLVTCPRSVNKKTLAEGLKKYGPKFILKGEKEPPETSEYIYILGVKCLKKYHVITFSDNSTLTFKDDLDLEKKLRKMLLEITTSLVRYYEEKMDVPYQNEVSVRKMKTRFGTNYYKKHHINFSYILIHYSVDIIQSVVVHELAHCFVYDHSKNFYDLVIKTLPEYKELDKKLKKGIYL